MMNIVVQIGRLNQQNKELVKVARKISRGEQRHLNQLDFWMKIILTTFTLMLVLLLLPQPLNPFISSLFTLFAWLFLLAWVPFIYCLFICLAYEFE